MFFMHFTILQSRPPYSSPVIDGNGRLGGKGLPCVKPYVLATTHSRESGERGEEERESGKRWRDRENKKQGQRKRRRIHLLNSRVA